MQSFVKKPTSVTYNITERCQSKCTTCNSWQTSDSMREKEMNIVEWKSLLYEMHFWLGNYSFILSGGEPFLRNDIFEFINFAANLGENINVITNGLYSIQKIPEFLSCGCSGIIVSLNSINNPFIHNESRGIDSAFQTTINFLQNLNFQNKKNNFKWKNIFISAILMPSNLSEIIPLAEFSKLENIEIRYQLLDNGDAFEPDKNFQTKEYGKNIKENAIKIIDELIMLKKSGYPIGNREEQLNAFKLLIKNPEQITDMKCMVGENNLAVDPYGNCRICFCKDTIGNVKDTHPKHLWYSEKADKIRDEILNCTKNCRLLNCNLK